MEDLVKIFESIRDIPYRIPLGLEEEDNCCSGKHAKLYGILKNKGCEVRYRVCVFLWSSMNLPRELEEIPHEKDSPHTYLEIKIENEWKTLDATWDKGLEGLFHINEWDGKSDTKNAVNPVKIFSPEKSLEIVEGEDEDSIKKDLEINGKFYKAFNEWLERNRH